MDIARKHLEMAPEIGVRRLAAYLDGLGYPFLDEWATMDLERLIERILYVQH